LCENVASLRDEPRKCVQLMAKVAHAVEYAHSRGVLHRDLKPGNILLDDRGEPLVSDFGLAKLLDAENDLTRSLTTFGTAGFIAPEQAGHAAVDFTPAADVYSLGAVLFNVLAGRPPFLGSNPVSVIRQASETQAPKLRSLAPSLDRDLETICARCLERDPKVRYQSAGDLAADLERWLAGRPIVARPVSPPARIWRWSRRNPKLVGAATAGLLLGAAAVWLFRAELFRASQFNPPDRSIAVLPFTDSSETKDQEYLCDGISEEILDTLAQADDLRVVGRSSSFSLKGKNTKEGGEKLNVGNVLEPSSTESSTSLHRSGLHICGRFRHAPPGHSSDRCTSRDGSHYQCARSRIGSRSANEQNYSGRDRCASTDRIRYQCARSRIGSRSANEQDYSGRASVHSWVCQRCKRRTD